MLKLILAMTVMLGGTAAVAWAQKSSKSATKAETTRIDGALKSAFAEAPKDWSGRLKPDATLKTCTAYRNQPPQTVAAEISAREKASIKYPDDG
ncbi:MAG: sulfur oxidation c-type cytochrome SoxX, partial [Hyphomicrobium sp.]